MGSAAHVIAVSRTDPGELLEQAGHRLDQLEQRWSRFIPTSTVSRLNVSEGVPQEVDPDTLILLLRSRDAWRLTAGLFDPTTLRSLMAAGYRTARDEGGYAGEPGGGWEPAPGFDEIDIDIDRLVVRFAPGIGFDPGGVGKGLAADIVAAELLDAGATGVLVNVGGDVRVGGEPSMGDKWMVTIEDPFDASAVVARLSLVDGAVATSTPAHRRWRVGGRAGIHIIDPRSGLPIATDVASVSVLTAQAWMAEAVAKAVAVQGSDAGLEIIEQAGLASVIVTTDGGLRLSSRLGGFL